MELFISYSDNHEITCYTKTSLRFFEVQSEALVKERNIVLNFGKISADNKTEQLGTEYKTYPQTATRNDEALL